MQRIRCRGGQCLKLKKHSTHSNVVYAKNTIASTAHIPYRTTIKAIRYPSKTAYGYKNNGVHANENLEKDTVCVYRNYPYDIYRLFHLYGGAIMTIKQALDDIRNIDVVCCICCNYCTAVENYCPTECAVLEKARQLDFNRIVEHYAKYDGDLHKTCNYIKRCKAVQL